MLFAAPALTMGLVAEEKRSGTIELLLTMPVRDADVIVGKYLGVLGLYAVLLLLTLVYPISVSMLGPLDWQQVAAGYIGVFLMGGAMLAVGLATSAWTENQLVAFFISFAICGALVGAVHGIEAIPSRWTEAVLSCRPEAGAPRVKQPRPVDYWPVDGLELAERLLATGDEALGTAGLGS